MITDKKRVRILLRVSSDQQLEEDGDLMVQRQLVCDYVKEHANWLLDEKDIKIQWRTGRFYKKPIRMQKIMNTIYSSFTRMTGSDAGCGKSAVISCH